MWFAKLLRLMRPALFFVLALCLTPLSWGSENWTMVNPGPTSNPLTSVIWTGSELVAVGDRGTVLISKDGVIWTSYRITDPAGDAVTISQIAFSGKQFVATGNVPGVVWTSKNGTQWQRVELGFSVEISKLIWTGQQYAGIGMVMELMIGGSRAHYTFVSSSDGVHWASVPINIWGKVGITDLTWTGKQYLLVGSRETNWNDWLDYINFFCFSRVFHTTTQIFVASSANGHAWSTSVLVDSEKPEVPKSIVWTGTQAIVIGLKGFISSSADGISWNQGRSIQGMEVGSDILNVVWTGHELIAVGDITASGDLSRRANILTSSDGISWVFHPLAPSTLRQVLSATWTGTQYVIVGMEGFIQTSPDCDIWTIRSPIGYTKKPLSKITSNGSMFVAVGGDAVVTSPDGEQWSLTNPTEFNAVSITWTGSMFIAVGKGGSVFTSADAKEWAVQKIEGKPSLHDVTWNGNLVVAVGDKGNESGQVIFTSSDGMNWNQEQVPEGLLGPLNGVTWTGEQFVAVGYNGAIITSQDSHNWKKVHEQDGSPLLSAVASKGNRLVAVGNGAGEPPNGLTSADGQTWTPIIVPFLQTLYGVAWCGDRFVAVGTRGTILTSKDGIQWNRDNVPSDLDFKGVICSGNKIVTVGESGTVLITPASPSKN